MIEISRVLIDLLKTIIKEALLFFRDLFKWNG